MVFRSLVAGIFAAGVMITGSVAAQVLVCPEPPILGTDDVDLHSEAEKMLKRLSVAFDLYGYEEIDQAAIMSTHEDTPTALVAKLSNVANRCAFAATSDLNGFRDKLPELRRLFLEAIGIAELSEEVQVGNADKTGSALGVQAATGPLTDAERLEQHISLSPRDLWQKLWFRSSSGGVDQEKRWAVIVASPADPDTGWDVLAEHQVQWKDVYFQLHHPYYEENNHLAVVVGRKLRRGEAERLLAYVKQLGMADDAYIWPVPADTMISQDIIDQSAKTGGRKKLDLTVLEN